MAKFYFIVFLALVVMSCNQAPKMTIGVHVEGIATDMPARIVTKDSVYQLTLDSTGSAKVVMADNLQSDYATFDYGGFQLPLYIESGKSFEIAVQFEGYRATPTFTGEGSEKNEYLGNEIFRKVLPDMKADEDGFMVSMDEQVAKLSLLLDSMAFDPQFNQLEKKRVHYLVYSLFPKYPSYHAYYAQDKDYQPSEAYFERLKSAIPEEEALIWMSEYQNALTGLVEVMAAKGMADYDALQLTKNQLDYVNENIKSPVLADYLVDNIASQYVGRSGVDHLDEIAPIYQAKVTTPGKKAAFEELCAKWQKFAKGQPSPDFKYLDINDKEVGLADLAGKYVLIDVWATWCGPCLDELPALKELEHKFKDKNIHFVSISCDQDKAVWQKKVNDDKLEGIQLHSGGDQEFMNAYMISGIPRFILLDREGNILAADMTRPSAPKTLETLSALEGI